MAKNGALNLKSSSLLNMYNTVKSYEATVQTALYDQYKAAYKISLTNYMRGDAADAFKSYFSQGTINMIQGLLDISSEMTMILQLIVEIFYQFESDGSGAVREPTMDSIEQTLKARKSMYEGLESELDSVTSAASSYISAVSLDHNSVYSEYNSVAGRLTQIRNDLYSADGSALSSAKELLDRINALRDQVSKTMGLCYQDGNFMPQNAAGLSSQSWYEEQSDTTLIMMLAEDPFEYEAGTVSVSEDQWAAGLCSDVYAYAGYSFLSASYEAGVEDGSAYINACAAVLTLNGYAQLTDYIKAQGEAKVVYAEADAKAGAGNGYFGARVEAEAGVIKVEGSVVVGTDDFNGYIKGETKVLCADGKVAFEFEEDGQYAIGVDASATLASAEGKAGFSFLSYKVNDGTATSGETEDLFKLSVSAEATGGGSFAVWSESKTAIEGDYFNINAKSLKLKGSFLGGGSISVTIPTVYFKWPW